MHCMLVWLLVIDTLTNGGRRSTRLNMPSGALPKTGQVRAGIAHAAAGAHAAAAAHAAHSTAKPRARTTRTHPCACTRAHAGAGAHAAHAGARAHAG